MQAKSIHFPWHQHEYYIISVYARGGNFTPPVSSGLKDAGMQFISAGVMGLKADRHWKPAWDTIYAAIMRMNAAHMVEVALSPADAMTQPMQARGEHKHVAEIQAIAEGLWLGDAVMEDRLLCYLQPVVSGIDKVFGYESFARVKTLQGDVIGGEAIIAASRALGMEYVIDRMLQVQAIKTFVSSDFNGFLFVNFLPGFIHRPAIYLEGLGETVRSHGVVAKHVVLEFTKSETPRDISHLKSVCEYGRSRGYSIALDDISTIESARRLVTEIRPDFVKIDMKLAKRVGELPARNTITQIVELVHSMGGTVIGEGIEDDDTFQKLKVLGVDLFQGFHFSVPVPVEKAIARSKLA